MLIIAKLLAKVLKILNSEVSVNQIAAGFALGALIGLIPVKGLLPYVLLILSFVVNVNLAIAAVATVLFKFFSYAIDPIANQLGYHFLVNTPALKSFWTQLYNMPLVPYTRFNNTLVLGSLIIGVILQIPLFILARFGVQIYRTRFRDVLLKSKAAQVLQASAFYRYYESYRRWKGE